MDGFLHLVQRGEILHVFYFIYQLSSFLTAKDPSLRLKPTCSSKPVGLLEQVGFNLREGSLAVKSFVDP